MSPFSDGEFGPDDLTINGHAGTTLLRINGGLDVGEVNKAKAPRLAGHSVINDLDVLDVSDTAKDLVELRLLGGDVEIEDADAGRLLRV